jgi:BlaI family transcriptional regulator, penicillinase repressor
MPTTPQTRLPRREREILDVLFAIGEGPAEDIRSKLTDPPSYSAVRALLARLEAKGLVRHREEGLRYVYAAAVPRTAARKAALKHHVRTFFGGSIGEMVTSLLRNETWSDEELASLQDEINRVRKERNS